jgi:hypothetical protein
VNPLAVAQKSPQTARCQQQPITTPRGRACHRSGPGAALSGHRRGRERAWRSTTPHGGVLLGVPQGIGAVPEQGGEFVSGQRALPALRVEFLQLPEGVTGHQLRFVRGPVEAGIQSDDEMVDRPTRFSAAANQRLLEPFGVQEAEFPGSLVLKALAKFFQRPTVVGVGRWLFVCPDIVKEQVDQLAQGQLRVRLGLNLAGLLCEQSVEELLSNFARFASPRKLCDLPTDFGYPPAAVDERSRLAGHRDTPFNKRRLAEGIPWGAGLCWISVCQPFTLRIIQ